MAGQRDPRLLLRYPELDVQPVQDVGLGSAGFLNEKTKRHGMTAIQD